MAGFPEIFIPLMFRGNIAFWHDFANIPMAAGSVLEITHGPPNRGFIYIYFQGNTGDPRRTDTDEVIRSVNAFMEHFLLPQTPEIASWPVKEHRDNLMESVYRPDYPLVTYSTFDDPMRLRFTNNELFNITWDITFWILEAPKPVFDDEIVPYLKGYFNFFKAFSEVEVGSGMAALFKILNKPSARLRLLGEE